MLKQKIKLFLLDVCGINKLFCQINREKALILMYHGVCDDSFDLLKGYDERHISKSSFKEQLLYLKRLGYRFATMTELVEAFQRGQKPGKLAVLTFDDGFRNVVRNAYPIMRELGAKGCIYPVVDLVGSDRLLWTDQVETYIRNREQGEFSFHFQGEGVIYVLDTKESREKAIVDIKRKLKKLPDKERRESLRQFDGKELVNPPEEFILCDWKDLKGLDNRVLEVGSHTISHPNCTKFDSIAELEAEVLNSKLEIEKMVGYEIKHFCYPFGACNEEVVKCLRNYGYESAVTTSPGFNDGTTDLLRLNRIAPGEDFLYFKAVVSGSYFAITRMR